MFFQKDSSISNGSYRINTFLATLNPDQGPIFPCFWHLAATLKNENMQNILIDFVSNTWIAEKNVEKRLLSHIDNYSN
jgi:hypothetical protein